MTCIGTTHVLCKCQQGVQSAEIRVCGLHAIRSTAAAQLQGAGVVTRAVVNLAHAAVAAAGTWA